MKRNILQNLLLDHYEEIQYTLHPRKTEMENIDKMLNCGDPAYGGAMYSQKRAQAMSFKLINCQHRHCVFTISKELRHYFFEDRDLLNCLFEAVSSVINRMFYKINKSQKFVPGYILVLHTFGRPLEWNPHIHCLISEGGVGDTGFWRKVNHFNYHYLRHAFQTALLNLMEARITDECLETFQSLMKQCKPLMKKVGKQDRIKLPSITGNVISIRPTLSIATMPKKLVDEFGSPSLSSEWKERKERFEEIIKANTCCECIHFIESDLLKSSPASVQALQNEPALHYTKGQYLAHIRNLAALTEANPNYKLIPLPATAFANMELLICDKAVQITHTCLPFITIEFTHPLMCHSFVEYTKRIINQYRIDRKSLLKMLKTKYWS